MSPLSFTDPMALLAIVLAMAMGGVLKGATGAGAPILAVPVMTALYDVRVAVVVMVFPSLLTNILQIRRYRGERVAPGFARDFALAGGFGTFVGTLLLVGLPVSILQLSMAGMIGAYILLRLARPGLKLALAPARRLVWPAGISAGILQGAVGLSAPISLTFLNAMRLERGAFIFTVSVFFAAMSLVQLVALAGFGLMTPYLAMMSLLALVPLVAAMPLGEWIGRRMPPRVFDLAILGFLAVVALRLVWVELG